MRARSNEGATRNDETERARKQGTRLSLESLVARATHNYVRRATRPPALNRLTSRHAQVLDFKNISRAWPLAGLLKLLSCLLCSRLLFKHSSIQKKTCAFLDSTFANTHCHKEEQDRGGLPAWRSYLPPHMHIDLPTHLIPLAPPPPPTRHH
jgi:hypothetical protein